jgi:energy-coupling factor transporter ATP-binding protein EcfA2
MQNGKDVVLRATGITKELPLGKLIVHALRGVDLSICRNEMVGIVGPSGSGKSTLLGLMGGLDSPTDGSLEIDGVDITHLSEGSISGFISEKADRAGTNGVAQDRIYLEITPSELPDEIIGANVRVTIPVSSTGGAVLAVPAAALSATANGSTILQVEGEDLALTTVTVETGLAAGGLVEVTPIGGDLVAGDLVVVGREGSSTGAGEPATDTSDDA